MGSSPRAAHGRPAAGHSRRKRGGNDGSARDQEASCAAVPGGWIDDRCRCRRSVCRIPPHRFGGDVGCDPISRRQRTRLDAAPSIACSAPTSRSAHLADAVAASDLQLSTAQRARGAESDDDAPIVQVVNLLIAQALRDRASDVHIEPQDDRIRVRFRIDGALVDVMSAAVVDRAGAGQPAQDHGRDEHRRAAAPAGRPVLHDGRRPRPRRARLDASPRSGGEDRDAAARQEPQRRSSLGELGMPADTHEQCLEADPRARSAW